MTHIEKQPSRENQLILRYFFVAVVLVAGIVPAFAVQNPGVVAITHTYEARIRLNVKASMTQVQASDAGQAKKLVQQQFPGATVLSVKKVGATLLPPKRNALLGPCIKGHTWRTISPVVGSGSLSASPFTKTRQCDDTP